MKIKKDKVTKVAARAGKTASAATRHVARTLHPWWEDLAAGFGICARFLGRGLLWCLGRIGHFLITPRLWVKPSLFISSYAFFGALLVVFGIVNLTRSYTPPADMDFWKVNRPASLIILDRDGNEIGVRGSHYGDPVSLEDLPPYVIDAFVATEDRRFYSHHGIDPRGLVRALLTNIRAGRMREGASTITQQLARNLFLSSERSLDRKLLEAHLAVWLENRLTKDEILSLYLNRIYLGAGAYGVEAASNLYFSKSAKDLTLSEAALLAALPKAPSTLAPTTNFEGARKRSLEVLGNLVETKSVDQGLVEAALLDPPVLSPKVSETGTGYFLDHALITAKKLVGEFDQDMTIETTLDSGLQRLAEAAVTDNLTDDIIALGAEQASLVAFNNDGELLVMVGGKSYEESQFNRATQAERQPGSAFKPMVYLSAIEFGLTPRSLFIDQEVDVDGWKPTNYSNTYQGPVRLSEAVSKSINTVAVQVTEMVGRQTVMDTANRMGLKSTMEAHPSIALGTMEVTLDELTAAYLPFARHGLAAEPRLIRRITARDGTVLYEAKPSDHPDPLMTPRTSDTMNHLLYQVVHNGTGARSRLGSRPNVGKTGTTNDWRDAWFIGYTAQITAGVWVGNDAYRPMDHVTGGSVPAMIWKSFMMPAHKGLPIKAIPGAKPAVSEAADLRLANFYSSLERDFASLQYAGYGQNTYDKQPWPDKNGQAVYVYDPQTGEWIQQKPAPSEQDDERTKDRAKPRRWFRFGK